MLLPRFDSLVRLRLKTHEVESAFEKDVQVDYQDNASAVKCLPQSAPGACQPFEFFLNCTIIGQHGALLSAPIYEGAIFKRECLIRLHALWEKGIMWRASHASSFTTRLMHEENFIKNYEVSIIRLDFYSICDGCIIRLLSCFL